MKETNSQRPLALMSLLHNGLRLHAAKTTQAQLGDRKRYVGLSDIAAFSVCPRKAVLQKQQPGTANFAKTLTLQSVFGNFSFYSYKKACGQKKTVRGSKNSRRLSNGTPAI